jgi:hypothetical protein
MLTSGTTTPLTTPLSPTPPPNDSTTVTRSPTQPVSTKIPNGGLSKAEIAGIIIGSVVGFITLIGTIAAVYTTCLSRRRPYNSH